MSMGSAYFDQLFTIELKDCSPSSFYIDVRTSATT